MEEPTELFDDIIEAIGTKELSLYQLQTKLNLSSKPFHNALYILKSIGIIKTDKMNMFVRLTDGAKHFIYEDITR